MGTYRRQFSKFTAVMLLASAEGLQTFAQATSSESNLAELFPMSGRIRPRLTHPHPQGHMRLSRHSCPSVTPLIMVIVGYT
jgi:hypothetical protein